jgi:hypothetical protein
MGGLGMTLLDAHLLVLPGRAACIRLMRSRKPSSVSSRSTVPAARMKRERTSSELPTRGEDDDVLPFWRRPLRSRRLNRPREARRRRTPRSSHQAIKTSPPFLRSYGTRRVCTDSENALGAEHVMLYLVPLPHAPTSVAQAPPVRSPEAQRLTLLARPHTGKHHPHRRRAHGQARVPTSMIEQDEGHVISGSDQNFPSQRPAAATAVVRRAHPPVIGTHRQL